MTVRAAFVIGAVVAVLTVPIGVGARHVRLAERRLEAQKELLDRTKADAQRVLELRSRRQRVAERKRPEQDVIARVNATLAQAGVPSRCLGGVRPESDASLAEAGSMNYRRQSVQIAFDRMTVSQLGSFLGAWHESQTLWTPTRIELLHDRNKADIGRYDVNVLVTATYLADS